MRVRGVETWWSSRDRHASLPNDPQRRNERRRVPLVEGALQPQRVERHRDPSRRSTSRSRSRNRREPTPGRNERKPTEAGLAIREFRRLTPAERSAQLRSYERRVRASYTELKRRRRPLSLGLLKRSEQQHLDLLRELAGQTTQKPQVRTTRRGVKTSQRRAARSKKKPRGAKKVPKQRTRRGGSKKNPAASTGRRSRVRLIP